MQPRAVKTVACILEAAAQILERHGIAAFNTNDVAERAGVSIGSLYQYFPGKNALLVALLRREKEQFRADAATALDLADGRAALAHLVGAAVRHQFSRPELARLLDEEEAQPDVEREVKDTSDYRELLRHALERCNLPARQSLEIAAEDLAALVRCLVDAAGARRDPSPELVRRRVLSAIFGYLGIVDRAPPEEM